MRIDRLKELQYMLENHSKIFPKVKFNIDSWGCKLDRRKGAVCDTAACALGSAALHKPFIEQGLYVKTSPHMNQFVIRCKELDDQQDWYPSQDAGEHFFDISEGISSWLFLPHKYNTEKVTPKMVARRVHALIALGRDPTCYDTTYGVTKPTPADVKRIY